ncbi:DUF659 domain-containing protein [Quillaja saponaria]|uniref:DUF659 domain-containing protein n=1 Tax=Quillaja saponaria TaxID=32244 RepID=A0AAD7P9Y2_QUISA|nr:DUF659 domain-containing protein [Quillaja saponaria]
MKMEEDEARRIFGGSARRTSVSSALVVRQVDKIATCISVDKVNENCDMYKISSKDKVDGAIARFFYGNGIPFNVAKSPFWVDMVRAINGAPKGYGPPSSEKIKTALLDKEKTKADQALIFIKQQWPTYGVSIVSDGWGNMKDESFMKIMAVSEGKAMLISGIDCSGDDISGEFIAESLLRAIESVGAYGVVQILTDNIPSCKAADKIIETAYPHIFWSGCMAHTLSLLLKDVVKSTNAALDFVSKCYQQAKGIMNYIKNHSSSFHVFRKFSALNALQVKKRRYGQHFVVIERILRLKSDLINMVLSEEWDRLKKGRSKSSMEHEEVRKIILNDNFWKKLKIILTFMKPIWDVLHFCDSDKACVGEIYQRMDDMLGYIKLALDENTDLCEIVQGFVVERWEKMDIPLHSLACVLTPYYYSDYWLTSLNPCGEKRNKPHSDPDVHKI